MAHFTIHLPDNVKAEVNKGKAFKKTAGFIKRWPFIKLKGEERAGYVIKVESSNEYHLIRTKGGLWTDSSESDIAQFVKKEGKWVATEETGIIAAIKKAIDTYENKQ